MKMETVLYLETLGTNYQLTFRVLDYFASRTLVLWITCHLNF